MPEAVAQDIVNRIKETEEFLLLIRGWVKRYDYQHELDLLTDIYEKWIKFKFDLITNPTFCVHPQDGKSQL